MNEKVVLAYSGGLDTTAIIPWLKENFGYDVICACVDCGQGNELDGLEERAKASGAEKLYILEILRRNSGSVSRTAEELGLVPSTLYRKISRWQKSGEIVKTGEVYFKSTD